MAISKQCVSIDEIPGTLIRHIGEDIKKLSTVYTHLDLHLQAYKVQLTQELMPNDHLQLREFVKWIIGHQQVDPDFCRRIILTDEAHFKLGWLY